MKKLFIFIVITAVVLYFGYRYASNNGIIDKLYQNKTFSIKEQMAVDTDNLENGAFFSEGFITYNGSKIIYKDYEGKELWQNEGKTVADNIYVTDKYIYRYSNKGTEVIDSSNKSYTITEITGKIINVSRENGRTLLVSKESDDANILHILDEKTQKIHKEQTVYSQVTCMDLDNKSNAYGYVTVEIESGIPVNTVYYVSGEGDAKSWNIPVRDEIVLGISISGEDVTIIGTDSINSYDSNGKLMWKNNNINRIKDFKIDKADKRIYILYENGGSAELMAYGMDGKVKNLIKSTGSMSEFKVYDQKIYVHGADFVSILHNDKTDELWKDKTQFLLNYNVDGGKIYILTKDKLISGKIIIK